MDLRGSEIVLFNLLQKLDPSISANLVVTMYKGKLFEKMPSEIRKAFINTSTIGGGRRRVLHNKLQETLTFPLKFRKYNNTVFYVNTMALTDIVKYAEEHKAKLIVHVHELEQMYKGLTEVQVERLVRYPQLIIANSKSSAKVLQDFGRKDNIEICYPGLDTSKIMRSVQAYLDFRRKLNINEGAFVWLMSGTMDENKNPYLFIDIAREIIIDMPNAVFLWIGTGNDKQLEENCRKRAKEKQVENNIIWLGAQDVDYYNYFNCADGFVLTSKKESFSLATLEALLLGLPVVANDCCGVREILTEEIGTIISEQAPAVKMAVAMKEYMSGKKKHYADKARERAMEFDNSICAARWNKILMDFFDKEQAH